MKNNNAYMSRAMFEFYANNPEGKKIGNLKIRQYVKAKDGTPCIVFNLKDFMKEWCLKEDS